MMDNSAAIDIQHRIRENAEDVQNYLLDLSSWEKDMRRKDEDLKNSQLCGSPDLPPIRNLLSKGKKKNKHKKQIDKSESPNASTTRCDYKASDKYDADSELKNMDVEHSSTSENNEEEEELSLQKRKQLAVFNKDKGNEYFKKGNFDKAIEFYTTGMELDPDNALLPANRAMAFLKKQQFQAAENDCTLCLSIDTTYVKAYLRRGTARSGLKNFSFAKDDFIKALEFEPGNKQAIQELKKLKKLSRGCDNKPRQDSLSDEEVVKSQNLWSQFLGHGVGSGSRANISAAKGSVSEQFRKSQYPDSCVISPVKKSSAECSNKPLMELKIKDFNPLTDSQTEGSSHPAIDGKDQQLSTKEVVTNVLQSQIATVEMTSEQEEVFPEVRYEQPQTSLHFLADWKKMRNHPVHVRFCYLQSFPAEKLPSLFKHSMDTDLFSDILKTLSQVFSKHGKDVYLHIKHLSEIGRFNTLVMFMSNSERKAVKEILDSAKSSRGNDPEVLKIMKRYNVT